MPHLHHTETFHLHGRTKSNVQMTPVTVRALAQAQVKAGLFEDFALMTSDIAGKRDLIAEIRPSLVARAAQGLGDAGKWGVFIQLLCAVKDQPRLMRVVTPQMIAGAAAYLLTPDEKGGNAKSFGLHAVRDFAEMADAIKDYPKLRAALRPDMVATVATELFKHSSHTTDWPRMDIENMRSHRMIDDKEIEALMRDKSREAELRQKVSEIMDAPYTAEELEYIKKSHSKVETNYYGDYIGAFCTLACAVATDVRLYPAIPPAQVRDITGMLFELGQQGVNEFQTDQGYPVEVRDGFTGFNPMTEFAAGIATGPQEWKEAVAEGFHHLLAVRRIEHRSMPFVAKVIKENPYILDAAGLGTVIDVIAERHKIDYSYLRSIAWHFADDDRFGAVMPKLARAIVEMEFAGNGEFFVDFNVGHIIENETAPVIVGMVEDMARNHDYGALSRATGRCWREGKTQKAITDKLDDLGIHILRMSRYDREDIELTRAMTCDDLCIVFCRASGEAHITPERSSGYTVGERPPRQSFNATSGLEHPLSEEAADLLPAVRIGFARAAAGKQNVPEWAQDIARKFVFPVPSA